MNSTVTTSSNEVAKATSAPDDAGSDQRKLDAPKPVSGPASRLAEARSRAGRSRSASRVTVMTTDGASAGTVLILMDLAGQLSRSRAISGRGKRSPVVVIQ